MPSTDNVTLQKIQREISDVLEREKELRGLHGVQNGDTIPNNNNEHETNNNIPLAKIPAKPVLQHSKSLGSLNSIGTNGINGTSRPKNGMRLFTPNPASKGVMHKFIKARGKINTVNGFQPSPVQVQQAKLQRQQTWDVPDFVEPPKSTEPGQYVRRGYVPVQVKMQKELEDLHYREKELRLERRKCQPEYSDDESLEDDTPQLGTTLKPARSMAQLYDMDEYREFSPSPSNLRPAKSLAELCDASEDEFEVNSHSLIMKWEELIQKNQKEKC